MAKNSNKQANKQANVPAPVVKQAPVQAPVEEITVNYLGEGKAVEDNMFVVSADNRMEGRIWRIHTVNTVYNGEVSLVPVRHDNGHDAKCDFWILIPVRNGQLFDVRDSTTILSEGYSNFATAKKRFSVLFPTPAKKTAEKVKEKAKEEKKQEDKGTKAVSVDALKQLYAEQKKAAADKKAAGKAGK